MTGARSVNNQARGSSYDGQGNTYDAGGSRIGIACGFEFLRPLGHGCLGVSRGTAERPNATKNRWKLQADAECSEFTFGATGDRPAQSTCPRWPPGQSARQSTGQGGRQRMSRTQDAPTPMKSTAEHGKGFRTTTVQRVHPGSACLPHAIRLGRHIEQPDTAKGHNHGNS